MTRSRGASNGIVILAYKDKSFVCGFKGSSLPMIGATALKTAPSKPTSKVVAPEIEFLQSFYVQNRYTVLLFKI